MFFVGKTLPFLPPMTGNGKHTTYKSDDDWGMVYFFVLPTLGFDQNAYETGGLFQVLTAFHAC